MYQEIVAMKKIFLIAGLLVVFAAASYAQSASDLNKQGLELVKKYDFKQAYDCFTKAIELKPDFGEAYYNRALAWFELPANAFPNADGCADLKKAKELGFKVSNDKMKMLGCQ